MKKLVFILLCGIMVGCQPQDPSKETLENLITPSDSEESATGNCFQPAMKQLETNLCIKQVSQNKYDKLSSLITELQKHMGESQYSALLQIEVNWEKIAKDHCEWVAGFFEGGSIQPSWFYGCLSRQYQQRIEELRLNLCEGYGMTGECASSLKYKE